MSTVSNLKKEAQQSCKFRGHQMSKFHRVTNFCNHEIWRAYCEICNKSVDVIPRPKPNQINIGGEAVALGCED